MNIEKNIPIPPRYCNSSKGFTETLRGMGIGDSVVIAKDSAASWRSCARTIGYKVVTRSISATESRLWRTK